MRPQTAKATRGRVIFLDIQPQAALSKSCGSASGFTLVWFCCESNHSAIIVLLLPLPNPVRTHFTYITIYSGYVFIFSCEISLVKCSLLARWISFSFVQAGAATWDVASPYGSCEEKLYSLLYLSSRRLRVQRHAAGRRPLKVF